MLVDGAWQSILGWQPEHAPGLVLGGDSCIPPTTRVSTGACAGCAPATAASATSTCGSPCGRAVTTSRTGPSSRARARTASSGSATTGIGCPRARRTRAPSSCSATRSSPPACDELEERYAAVERFAATAAHQLAEPLVIAESSAILVAEELGDDLDPMLRGRLDAIGRGAARARRLMDALLAEARTAGLPLELRPVELGAVVDDDAGEHRPRRSRNAALPSPSGRCRASSAKPASSGSCLRTSSRTPSSTVRAAAASLRSQPRSNARPGASRWRTRACRSRPPRPGAIFQPFHRAPGERRVPGVGLGLAICAQLVQRIGGSIGVESGAGSGNVFWIELRAA